MRKQTIEKKNEMNIYTELLEGVYDQNILKVSFFMVRRCWKW